MSGLADAYDAIVAQLKAAGLELSRSIISRDHPATNDAHGRITVHMTSGSSSIDRELMRCPQRVEVWFVLATNGAKYAETQRDALRIEQRIIKAMHDRRWHDPPIDLVVYLATLRAVTTDGSLYRVGVSFDVRVIYDASEEVA